MMILDNSDGTNYANLPAEYTMKPDLTGYTRETYMDETVNAVARGLRSYISKQRFQLWRESLQSSPALRI